MLDASFARTAQTDTVYPRLLGHRKALGAVGPFGLGDPAGRTRLAVHVILRGIRVDVAVTNQSMGPVLVVVAMTNTERRTVTIGDVALQVSRDLASPRFDRWHSRNVRIERQDGFPLPRSDAPLPMTLDPGSATYAVVASPSGVKARLFPAVPAWAVCEDSYGNRYWGRVPDDVKSAIKSAKRQVPGPDDDYGQRTWIDIEDDVYLDPGVGDG